MTRQTPPGDPDRLLRAAAGRLDRRRFLTVTSAVAALAFSFGLPGDQSRAGQEDEEPRPADELPPETLTEDPFTLGVASGDPLPDAVVLWTRLAPRPLEPGSGMPAAGSYRVTWEIARDERFRHLQRRGSAYAHAEFNHAVHVDARGLGAGREYWYRFTVGRWRSPVARTRTLPARDADPARMRLALVSCQNYADGYYTLLRHAAAQDVEALFHVGDYIYENPVSAVGGHRRYTDRTLPAQHNREPRTLADYRLRYSLHKSDPDLQAAHHAHPWFVTWDDHEVHNDYSGTTESLVRRAAAYRAYWENQPLRLPQPDASGLTLYRRVHYGRLAQFDILDTRQYRDAQAGREWRRPLDAEARDPRRTLMGATQERWFADGLRDSDARWNVVPQQVVLSRCAFGTRGSAPVLSMDAWDGYPAARERFLAAVDQAGGNRNLVLLTGDAHVAHAFDVKRDFDDPGSRTVGAEFVCSSVTTERDGSARPANWAGVRALNPHMKFYDGRRGYTVITLDRTATRADFHAIDRVTRPDGRITPAGSFVTEAGNPGVHPA
ncbi:alkaline phosphatase D family protein [Kitasatospora phosalacinea]|uniref:alkaline phosphatase D family protein n=1 Tax=Kitasatospora phosalacinea TaxID=2065 RepID=UPI0035E25A62